MIRTCYMRKDKLWNVHFEMFLLSISGDASFIAHAGLATSSTGKLSMSWESANFPSHWLTHHGDMVSLVKFADTKTFKEDSSWVPILGKQNPKTYRFLEFDIEHKKQGLSKAVYSFL